MSIGLNINGLAVPSKAKLFDAVQQMRPKWSVVMDDLTLAKELAYHFPNTRIAFRRSLLDVGGQKISDESITEKLTPEQWLEQRERDTDGKIALYTTNEPGFNQRNIDWLVKLMVLCVPRHIPLVIGNWSCGVPTKVDTDWHMAKVMLQLLDQHRDLFVLGLHEYWAGMVTSGFVGGAPDDTKHHPDFTLEANWPTKDTRLMTMWHCGRFKFLLNYCKEVGITPPRIVMTEHGADYLSDTGLGDYLQTITPAAPFSMVRGWRTLENYWREKLPGHSHPMAYTKQLLYADQHVYGFTGSPVECQCIYTWSQSPDWIDFDISGSPVAEFLGANRRNTDTYSTVPAPPPPPIVIPSPPPPPPVPVPVTRYRIQVEWDSDPRLDQIMTSTMNLVSAVMGDKISIKPVTV